MPDTLLSSLAEGVCSLDFEEIPDDVVAKARDVVVDSLGCALMGADSPGVHFARQGAGGGRGRLLGWSGALGLEGAAFGNAAAIRVLDMNDTLGIAHPSDMLGAVFALTSDPALTGRDVARSVVAGYRAFAMVEEVLRGSCRDGEYHVPPLTLDYGYSVCVGATAAVSAARRLPLEQTRQALSLAACGSLSLRANRAGELSSFKALSTAVSARLAILYVSMAEAGLTGPEAPFLGRHGLTELLTGQQGGEPPGESWGLPEVQLKYFPVTANNQAVAWSALQLRAEVDPRRISRILCETSTFLRHESGSEPAKWRPTTKETADHSLPYILARTLLNGEIVVDSYTHDKLADPEVLALMDTIEVRVDDDFEREWPRTLQVRVSAVDGSGERHVVTVRDPLGTPANPLSRDDMIRKFELAGDLSAFPAWREAFAELWDLTECPSVAAVLDRVCLR